MRREEISKHSGTHFLSTTDRTWIGMELHTCLGARTAIRSLSRGMAFSSGLHNNLLFICLLVVLER
jgi:hypothetical protein